MEKQAILNETIQKIVSRLRIKPRDISTNVEGAPTHGFSNCIVTGLTEKLRDPKGTKLHWAPFSEGMTPHLYYEKVRNGKPTGRFGDWSYVPVERPLFNADGTPKIDPRTGKQSVESLMRNRIFGRTFDSEAPLWFEGQHFNNQTLSGAQMIDAKGTPHYGAEAFGMNGPERVWTQVRYKLSRPKWDSGKSTLKNLRAQLGARQTKTLAAVLGGGAALAGGYAHDRKMDRTIAEDSSYEGYKGHLAKNTGTLLGAGAAAPLAANMAMVPAWHNQRLRQLKALARKAKSSGNFKAKAIKTFLGNKKFSPKVTAALAAALGIGALGAGAVAGRGAGSSLDGILKSIQYAKHKRNTDKK